MNKSTQQTGSCLCGVVRITADNPSNKVGRVCSTHSHPWFIERDTVGWAKERSDVPNRKMHKCWNRFALPNLLFLP